jgi:hypothetical protein
MPGMHWSIGEQNIPATAFMGDHHPHLSRLRFYVNEASSHECVLDVDVEPDTDEDPMIVGYRLYFNRNGEFLRYEIGHVPNPQSSERSAHSAKGKHR